MTALHLISGRGPTGAAAAAINDILSLRAAGIRACAACRHDAPAVRDALLGAGVPSKDIFSEFSFGRGALGMLTTLRDATILSRIARLEAVDTIHVHRAAEHWLALLIPGRNRRGALVRTWHRSPLCEHRPILSTLAGHTAGCVCVAREHEALLLGAGAARARFIHAAVDTDFFQPTWRDRPGPEKLPPIVIGQAARWKRERGRDRGQRFTLDIFSKLSPALTWRGELVGRGELERELTIRAFTELRLPPERVAIVGTQGKSADEFAAILSGLDVGLVFCVGSDGGSRPALEMLACGVPLLVSDTPGLRELADDSECARVVLRGGVDEWVRAIEALLREPDVLKSMQASARKRAETTHSFRARGAALAEFYRECREER